MYRTLTLTALSAVFGLGAAQVAVNPTEYKRVQNLAKAELRLNPGLSQNPHAVIVKFKSTAAPSQKAQIATLAGVQRLAQFERIPGLELVSVKGSVNSTIAALKQLPNVEFAEPDYVVKPSATPNDPYFGYLWGLHNTGNRDMNAPEAWDVFTGSSNFVVAVIDTGVQWSHPDLAANIWTNPGEIAGNGVDDDSNGFVDDVRGWDFYQGDNNPDDSDGHGTHVAGTIGAVGNNGVGVVGVNWNVKIMPLRFMGPEGGYTSDAVRALNYAIGKGVKVSNNSWGGSGYSQSLYNAISAAQSSNHVFVAASGNEGLNIDSTPSYPGAYNLANIISVAATDSNDGLPSWSNTGATHVDLGAPGVDIFSTVPGGYGGMSGTSMASPHVAGVAAAVFARNPGWSHSQVKNQILSTVRPVASLSGRTVTGGVVNLQAALAGGGSATNAAPNLVISSPTDGATLTAGTVVTFSATATDPEDGNLGASIQWTSSLQGSLGTGTGFTRTNLVAGTHVISAKVTDSGGATITKSVNVTVTNPVSLPNAPSNPSASRIAYGWARFRWSDNSANELRFEVERQKLVNGVYTAAGTGTFNANTTYFNDNTGRGTFRYRVRAVNSAGASSWTSWASVRV